MFATIRQTFPSTRTLSDGRLTAIVGAAMLLLLSLADADTMTTAGIVAGAVVVVVLMRRARGGHGDQTVVGLCTPADRDDAVFAAPHPVRTEAATTASADDMLLARAIALRDRVSVRR